MSDDRHARYDKAYAQGRARYKDGPDFPGQEPPDNPYPRRSMPVEYDAWRDGWDHAEAEEIEAHEKREAERFKDDD